MIPNYTIFNDNALNVLDRMITNGTKVDMIFTDPPYRTTARGCAGNSGGMLQKDINKRGQVFTHNDIDIEDYLPLFYKVLKQTGITSLYEYEVEEMELFKKTCKNQKCGKEFMGTRTQQYCCSDCRVPTYKPRKKYKTIKNCTLGEVSIQAKKLGISYGKYVAIQYLEEQKERMKR